MDRVRLTQVFTLECRRGANERAAAGVTPSSDLRPPTAPSPPADCGSGIEQQAWADGYGTGYQVGASDAQLASVDEPGAHGMVSGYGEQFLEMFDFSRDYQTVTQGPKKALQPAPVGRHSSAFAVEVIRPAWLSFGR